MFRISHGVLFKPTVPLKCEAAARFASPEAQLQNVIRSTRGMHGGSFLSFAFIMGALSIGGLTYVSHIRGTVMEAFDDADDDDDE